VNVELTTPPESPEGSIFKQFARHWFEPLVQLALECSSAEKYPPATFSAFHYFFRDLCYVLTQWATISDNAKTPQSYVTAKWTHDEMAVAKALVLRIMTITFHSRQQIRKGNAGVLQALVESWKPQLDCLPLDAKSPILQLMQQTNPKREEVCKNTALLMLNTLLVNEIKFAPVSAELCSHLQRCMELKPKSVWYPAAQCAGRMLKTKQGESDFEQAVIRILKAMYEQGDHDRFLEAMAAVTAHYPAAGTGVLLQMFSLLNVGTSQYHGKFKQTILQVCEKCIPISQEVFLHLRPHLAALVQTRDDETQTRLLKAILVAVPTLDGLQLQALAEMLPGAFCNHSNDICRELYYEVISWMYDHDPTSAKSVQSLLSLPLLQGLTDEGGKVEVATPSADGSRVVGNAFSARSSIKNRVFGFWDVELHLPFDPLDRLLRLFTSCFHPQLERHWPVYSALLLLRLSHRR
jgi:hypothetical protein